MTDTVGLVVRGSPSDPIPLEYLSALTKALSEFGLSSEAKADNEGFTNSNVDVHVRVRGANGTTSNYQAIADAFLDTDHATIVLVADAQATTIMRDRTGSGAKKLKAVSGVSFDPEYFSHVSNGRKHDPDKNVTGVLVGTPTLNAERLTLLKQVTKTPSGGGDLPVAVVYNSSDSCATSEANAIAAAGVGGVTISLLGIASIASPVLGDFQTPLQNAVNNGVKAFLIIRSPFFQYNRNLFVQAANTVGVPTMYPFVDYVYVAPTDAPKGLISYGPDRVAGMEFAGRYVARLLTGAKIKDLPFSDPVGFITAISESTWSAQVSKLNPAGKPSPYLSCP